MWKKGRGGYFDSGASEYKDSVVKHLGIGSGSCFCEV